MRSAGTYEREEKRGRNDMENKTKVPDLVYTAMGVALICVCSWISIPFTVPFTLQTFAIPAVLLILGGKRGTIATVVYVLMGALGIPVFAGFTGGPGILLGSTGGYIMGFIFIALLYLLITWKCGTRRSIEIAALIAGLLVCYAFGTAWFMYVYLRDTGEVGLFTVLTWCVFPYILPDLVKLFLAVVIADRVKPFVI